MEGDYLRISIKDTGLGISETDLEKIFDRFYRVKDERAKYVVGSGLGLAIVKSIVEAHHGMIRVEERARPRQHLQCLSAFYRFVTTPDCS